ANFAHINGVIVTLKRAGECLCRIEGYGEFPCQAITRTSRNQRQCGGTERQGAANLIHSAITTPCEDYGCLLLNGLTCQIVGMACTFSDQHFMFYSLRRKQGGC